MSDLQMWTYLAGVLVPLGVAVVEQSKWSKPVRAVVAVVCCLAVAAITSAVAGDLNGKAWVTASLIIMVAAMATYSKFWKPTGIVPAIEKATNFL